MNFFGFDQLSNFFHSNHPVVTIIIITRVRLATMSFIVWDISLVSSRRVGGTKADIKAKQIHFGLIGQIEYCSHDAALRTSVMLHVHVLFVVFFILQKRSFLPEAFSNKPQFIQLSADCAVMNFNI